MLRLKLLEASLVAAGVAFSAGYTYADDFSARLSGFNEIGSIPTSVTVPAIPSVPSPALTVTTSYTGAVLSDGRGTVELNLDKKAGAIAYTLTYSNVGTTPPKTGTVLFAHIHFGKSHDSGGILCSSARTSRLPVRDRLHRRVILIVVEVEPCPARGQR